MIGTLIVAAVFMLVLIAAIMGCLINGSPANMVMAAILMFALVEFAVPILRR